MEISRFFSRPMSLFSSPILMRKFFSSPKLTLS
jgi:hypothetical protein